MNRPYVICHMMTALDGKIIGNFMETEEAQALFTDYVAIQENYQPQAWICGRTTMAEAFAFGEPIEFENNGLREIPRTDHIVDENAKRYMIALDPKGKLRWTQGTVPVSSQLHVESHIVIILSENVSDDYLRYLQDLGISYLFGGTDTMDLPSVLERVKSKLHAEVMMLDGGGVLNGSFLQDGLVDELSLMLVPAADGHPDTPALFVKPNSDHSFATRFRLDEVKQLDHDGVYLNYKVKEATN